MWASTPSCPRQAQMARDDVTNGGNVTVDAFLERTAVAIVSAGAAVRFLYRNHDGVYQVRRPTMLLRSRHVGNLTVEVHPVASVARLLGQCHECPGLGRKCCPRAPRALLQCLLAMVSTGFAAICPSTVETFRMVTYSPSRQTIATEGRTDEGGYDPSVAATADRYPDGTNEDFTSEDDPMTVDDLDDPTSERIWQRCTIWHRHYLGGRRNLTVGPAFMGSSPSPVRPAGA